MNRARMILCALGTVAIVATAAAAHAADLSKAQQNYNMICAACHGKDGGGDGPAGSTLSVRPRDFKDCAAMKKISDDTLFGVIKNGGAAYHLSPEMQPWGTAFSDDDMHGLVAYIRQFCKK